MSPNDIHKEFIDFSAVDHVQVVASRNRGNIIRGNSAETVPGAAETPVHSHAPEVIIHRTGEAVSSIEFVCSCGQRAVVNLEYAEE